MIRPRIRGITERITPNYKIYNCFINVWVKAIFIGKTYHNETHEVKENIISTIRFEQGSN